MNKYSKLSILSCFLIMAIANDCEADLKQSKVKLATDLIGKIILHKDFHSETLYASPPYVQLCIVPYFVDLEAVVTSTPGLALELLSNDYIVNTYDAKAILISATGHLSEDEYLDIGYKLMHDYSNNRKQMDEQHVFYICYLMAENSKKNFFAKRYEQKNVRAFVQALSNCLKGDSFIEHWKHSLLSTERNK